MVAAQHDTHICIEQTQVIFGVAGSVNGHPLTTRKRNVFALSKPHSWLWNFEQLRQHAKCVVIHFATQRQLVSRATPRCFTCAAFVARNNFHIHVVRFVRIEPQAEALMGNDVGSRCRAKAGGTPEMVGMAVGDHYGVNPLQRHS